MGFVRRVDPRRDRSEEPVYRDDASGRPRRGRAKRGLRHHVRPEELGRKLVKEMEARKVSHSSRETVCNRFTIFLCREDYKKLYEGRDGTCRKLERLLGKHARRKRYVVMGDIGVSMVMDEDLPLGRFGILAERHSPSISRKLGRSAVAGAAVGGAPAPAPSRSPLSEPAPGRVPGPAPVRADADIGGTKIIGSEQAAAMGLAHQAIVLRSDDKRREFTKGRVIVGRARDVDFRVDDPNVSRRHAAIYWDDGDIVVQDLDSTNGTMVNGYPVNNTVLGPDDVLVVGECRIRVESR